MTSPCDRVTWAALLGRWVTFARGALAWPNEGEGQLLRESVADLIMLQAVVFALEHLTELDAGERALGLDRAALLIEKHAGALAGRWGDNTMPPAMRELVGAARDQLARQQGVGPFETERRVSPPADY